MPLLQIYLVLSRALTIPCPGHFWGTDCLSQEREDPWLRAINESPPGDLPAGTCTVFSWPWNSNTLPKIKPSATVSEPLTYVKYTSSLPIVQLHKITRNSGFICWLHRSSPWHQVMPRKSPVILTACQPSTSYLIFGNLGYSYLTNEHGSQLYRDRLAVQVSAPKQYLSPLHDHGYLIL